MLQHLGADVYGYALEPPTSPSLFVEAEIEQLIASNIGDVRNLEYLQEVINDIQPEIVIHMAAQALVRDSYKDPVLTYSTNVMGTVNILEACRHSSSVKSVVNVTTDKCYENKEWAWGYRENEAMGGYDPYSSSKGCSELVTAAYRNSFFNAKDYENHGLAIGSARAGNVIGGGDWANDRLIPDFIKAISNGETLMIRSPYAIRPWQHVLEPLSGYILLAENLYTHGHQFAEAWNFGPNDSDAKNVEWITKTICNLWGGNASFEIDANPQPHEANYLKLDCSKAKADLGWSPKWDIMESLESIISWNKERLRGENVRRITMDQITEYLKNI